MRVEHEKFESRVFGRDRYVMFDADGERLDFETAPHVQRSYVQRPVAEKRARRDGYGLYDVRNKEVVVQPDVDKRIAALEERRSGLIADADACAQKVIDIHRAQAREEGREHGEEASA